MLQGEFAKVDINNNNRTDIFSIGQALGTMALRESNGFVLAAENGFGLMGSENDTFLLLENSPIERKKEVRFNDGAVDPVGRFLCGTMEWDGAKDIGELYSLDTNGKTKLLETGLEISNGMDWTPDGKVFYLTDTLKHVIYAYDYNLETGDISNRRNHIVFAKDEFPDGMTVDVYGEFWVAMWGGSKIVHFDKAGHRLEEIMLPVSHPTSCCFGGENMDILFITTSQFPLTEDERRKCPDAGKTFAVKTKTKGQIQQRYRG